MNERPRFTPGPWRIWPEATDHYLRVRGTQIGGTFHIADVRFGAYRGAYRDAEARGYSDEQRQEAAANARLIAAAPDLYAALDALLEAHAEPIDDSDGRPITCHCRECSRAREAIAKVLG